MSQGVRNMLANRRFAVPLIILLAFCLIGLILIGAVLIWQPSFLDGGGTTVAQESATATLEPTASATLGPTATATATATPQPSPTLVPLGTQPVATSEATVATAEVAETQDATQLTTTAVAGQTATAEEGSGEEATPAPTEAAGEGEELAQTGVGWGLILFSGVGLGLLAAVARRLRLTLQ
jgi:cytoskeletal protein RodZ